MPTIPISRSDRLFILSGAGLSAESGLPTFRGANGIWRNHRVEEVASPVAWARDPEMVWQFYTWRREVHQGCRPNPGHQALAELESKLGERLFHCTQNVDSLLDQAGAGRVVHMHGRLFWSRCDRRGCPQPPFPDERGYPDLASIPGCVCGGRIRPHICWFGETPFHLDEIFRALASSSVFLCVGSSGVVEPAASFAAGVKRHSGARTYYVGPEVPANRDSFDECFQGKAGEVLPELFQPARKTAAAVCAKQEN